MELRKRLNNKTKKINKDKGFDLNKGMNLVFEQKNLLTALVNSETKINLIKQTYVIS